MQEQEQQLEPDLKVMDQPPQSEKECLDPAQASLEDVQASLRTTLQLGGEKDRLGRESSQKREFEGPLMQSQPIQTPLNWCSSSSLRQDIEGLLAYDRQLHRDTHTYRHADPYVRERIAGQVYEWNWLAKSFGIKAGVIISKVRNQRTHIFTRWPLYLPFGQSQVITGSLLIQNLVPSLPKVVSRPQNVISSESRVIKACESGDIPEIQELLKDKQFHPNDRTPDDFTVFRYAIGSENPEVVRLLLENGADPNLPYGKFETSPLHRAFDIGNVGIIRLLLDAGADLEYKSSKLWTSVSFLWHPSRPAHTTTTEIIQLCASRGFSAWNDPDIRGWNPVHHAAAWGRGEDIRNLSWKGANLHSYTTDFLWGPMTCAVWHNNPSTFDAFMYLFEIEEIVGIIDSRGWTLLHMATKNGCEHILRTLLAIGADREVLTMGTQWWILDELDGKRLTAETIARAYGHGALWDKLVEEVDNVKGR